MDRRHRNAKEFAGVSWTALAKLPARRDVAFMWTMGPFGNTVVPKLVTHMESVKSFEYSMRKIFFSGWNVNSEFPSL